MEIGSEEEKGEKLDAEFDHFVNDKGVLFGLENCEPSGTGAGIMSRRNWNLYAKLLLHMLKRGVLEGPFTHRPEPGTLKSLPSYMSIYFDEPNNPARAKGSSPEELPDWVKGELETSEHRLNESWKLSSGESALVQSPTDGNRPEILWWTRTDEHKARAPVHMKLFHRKGKQIKMEKQKGRGGRVRDIFRRVKRNE